MHPGGVVVIGGYINGLGVIRALAARGIPTALITTEPYDIAQHSRHVVIHESVIGRENQPDAIAEILEHQAQRWRGWAVIPTTDPAIQSLADHRDRLNSNYRILAAPPSAAKCLLDKTAMLQAAQSVGIRIPHCYGPADSNALMVDGFRFPVVVKPIVRHKFSRTFSAKLFPANDRNELSRHIAQVETAGIDCGIYDLIPGPDDRIYAYCIYMNSRSEPTGGMTIRKIRQSPPLFGVARVAEVVDDIPELRDATISLLRKIGFHGMAAAEFKFDVRDRTFRFMEVNGRSVLYNGLLRRAGLDLTGMMWSDQICGEIESPKPNGWPGAWVNLHADLLYSALRRRENPVSWSDFVAPYTRPTIEAVWSSDDRRPFIAQWSKTFREAFGSMRSAAR